jgi:glycosyltransferase involved in cell wall biosynthesis
MLWVLLRRHNDLVVRYSDGVVVCSSGDREFIVRNSRINADRVLALAPGVPEAFLTAASPVSADRLHRLLYVGQFAPFKAPEIVSRVIAETLQTNAAATATWVCHRDHHSAAQDLLPFHLRHRVAFLGWMPREELRAVYDDHGILLLPSHFEGFSLTLLEAMARGLCVLCTRVGGAPDVVVEGESGFLFEPGDVNGLTQRAILLTSDRSLAVSVSRNAIQTAERFTWDGAAQRLTQFYSHLEAQRELR